MSEDFGSDYITIEDEDGNEFELEHILTTGYNGSEYALFLPADMEEDDPDFGYIILKITEENGDELYNSVDDENELAEVYDLFMELLFREDNPDGEEDENSGE
ncbi:MAG TPA: DUF1292 domain-containing protein [Clostridiales bacterium]|nr:DUF1292 domain-containing protein [Clostridiales bacterium]HBR09227.1 DUF1292 domain-containing protein [Clostridiales bacterium]